MNGLNGWKKQFWLWLLLPLRLSVLRLWQQTRLKWLSWAKWQTPKPLASSRQPGTLNNGIVKLMTVTTAELLVNQRIPYLNTSSLVSRWLIGAIGGPDENNVTGLSVKVTGTTSSSPEILDNVAANGAGNIGIGIQKKSNSARIQFDGHSACRILYPTPGN